MKKKKVIYKIPEIKCPLCGGPAKHWSRLETSFEYICGNPDCTMRVILIRLKSEK